ncbi:MAG: thiamine pyrophosphate-dependent enzyme [Candidatus Omnitrophota bacterium]
MIYLLSNKGTKTKYQAKKRKVKDSRVDAFDDTQIPPFRAGKRAPLSINPEQIPAFRPGCVERVDYSKVIVKKPWGYEYLVFQNDYVAIWMLQIIPQRRTSMHCHPAKKTGLIVLSGKAKLHHVDGALELDTLDGVMIDPGVFHCTEAFNPYPLTPQSENGIWVMEIESPPMKSDLIRLDDAYGRKNESYEGQKHMVHEPAKRLEFSVPSKTKISHKKFFNCDFSIRQGSFKTERPRDHALISVIGKNARAKSNNPYLKIGALTTFKEFENKTRQEDLGSYTFLVIERKEQVMKVADYVFSSIAELGIKQVFAVSGGGAMHLVDSLGRHPKLEYIATYHEQAAAMAAEAYARLSDTPGAALVTSGPGGTNTITGVCGAWIDSIPTIFISGQVTTDTLLRKMGLRQFGIQEADIVSLVKPITKYAVTVTDPKTIKYHVQKAIHLATSGRPGPVWLDIPLDVQSKLLNIDELKSFTPKKDTLSLQGKQLKKETAKALALLKKAKRPVLISGYGVRLAKATNEFQKLLTLLNIPLVSSWTSSDLVDTKHRLYVGRGGIMGERAANFAVQNADVLLIIGSRMSIPQVGYNYRAFAREAKKIVVDIDSVELKKKSLKPDLAIRTDAKDFIAELTRQFQSTRVKLGNNQWRAKCQGWKKRYPVVLPEYRQNKKGVNSFYFIDVLSKKLKKDAIVVTDMGTSFTCTMQTFKVKKGQRLFTSSGHASMGFGLPGAIGACFGSGRKKVICVSGDGGLQMNIQELQTLIHYRLPVILFVLNNQGYLTIKLMQQNHFGRYVGSDAGSGVSFPDIVKVARAYGIRATKISNQKQLRGKIDRILAERGPFVCEIVMPEDQPLIPRVSSLKKPDGTIISRPLEDLYPFLSREEFAKNMIVKPFEPLK